MSRETVDAPFDEVPIDRTMTTNEKLMETFATNAMTTRSQLIKELSDPRRDYDDECGYPNTITKWQYRRQFDRDPIANRVVSIFPVESWQNAPIVFETEDLEHFTPFEIAWEEVGDLLQGPSWAKDPDLHPVWSYLERADILSGIGAYGVLLIGVDDGKDLQEPVEEKQGSKLIYLRAFDHSLVVIASYEMDENNPRFGQPTAYDIEFSDPSQEELHMMAPGVPSTAEQTAPHVSKRVHWSRCIHLVDNLISSEVIGQSRLYTVWNNILNLIKLYGGSAEMYWRGAFPGLSIETYPELGMDAFLSTEQKQEQRQQMEQYQNGLQRFLTMQGMSVKSLAPQVVDPRVQIDVQLEAICINKATPKRIFLGSERGELGSTQDANAWNDRMQHRQGNYIVPRVINPLIDRLIMIGILPQPKQYTTKFPDLESSTALEKAEVAAKRTEALIKYIQGGGMSLIEPLDFLVKILNVPLDEAKQMLEEYTLQQQEDKLLPLQGIPGPEAPTPEPTGKDTTKEKSNDIPAKPRKN
jgi:hypothetical protein